MSELHETQSFNRLLDALGDIKRRKLLVALLRRTPQTDMVDLADTAVATDGPQRRVELQHVHLPKLAEYGLITWNKDTNEVAPGPAFNEIRPLVALLVDHEDELPSDCL